jgi:hypothetical protein
MSTMTRKKRRLRRAFRRWASFAFWISPLWSFPAAFGTMTLGLLPVEAAFILFVGVLPAMMWVGIRLTGYVVVKMTKEERRHYERLRRPLEIASASDAAPDETEEAPPADVPTDDARPGKGSRPPAGATIN